MKVLILGSSGYIGKHVVNFFNRSGHEVFGIDLTDNMRDIYITKTHFTLMDICNTSELIQFIQATDIEVIINLAARKSVSESFEFAGEYMEVNADAVSRLVGRLSETRVRKFLQASSAAIYGPQSRTLIHENVEPNPSSPYAISKLKSEEAIIKSSQDLEIDFYILRFFNVLGSEGINFRDSSQDNLVPSILRKHRNSEAALIYGNNYKTKDGTCIRDYVHVLDVALAIHALVKLDLKFSGAQILNIGSGKGHSVLEVITTLSSQLGQSIAYQIAQNRPGDIPAIVADISRIHSLIDFVPKYDFFEMLNSSH
jgi:UDP-glucose 4-epimerase